jgi:hypothetical protein
MQLTGELYEQVVRAIRSGPRRSNDGRRLARAGVVLAVIILRGRKRERRVGVRVRDVSPTGLGFISTEPLTTGEEVVIELERRGGAPPLHIVGRVQHCEQVAHRVHRVGVLFITDSNGTDYARRASQARNAIPS